MKNLLLGLALIATALSYSQSVKISGTVKDSLGQGLELANIIAYTQKNAVAGYSITSSKGQYSMNVPKDSTYLMRVTYLGYATQEKTIEKALEDMVIDFTMKEDAASLDAVELTYEMPVEIKGDTIVYNADSFTDGSEKKLEDVIDKLPGVAMTDDGQI